MHVKDNCWKWPEKNQHYFIKLYKQRNVLEKVKMIHENLQQINFPYIISLEKSDSYTIKQQWQENARSANFDDELERELTLQCLKKLHETSTQIDWSDQSLPYFNLRQKWQQRLRKFQLQQSKIEQKIGPMYEQIAELAEQAMANIDFSSQQEQPTILHGDVVHHNFLRCEDGRMLIIDFDLACCGESTDELVLWCHRALPHINYDVNKLLNSHPYLRTMEHKKSYLSYPNELLREAIYFSQLDAQESDYYRQFFIPFANEAIKSWPRLIEQVCE